MVKTLTMYVKKSVLLVDLVNPKNSGDTVGKIKNQLPGKDWYSWLNMKIIPIIFFKLPFFITD